MLRTHPTLLNSCAMATTAAEARFRIGYSDHARRAARVIALDEPAAGVVRGLAGHGWGGGHFLVFDRTLPADGGRLPVDAALRTVDGAEVLLSDELAGADTAVVVATASARLEAAEVIGDACAARKIMSAGFVLGQADQVQAAVSVLRPNVMVLMVLKDRGDIAPILNALRV